METQNTPIPDAEVERETPLAKIIEADLKGDRVADEQLETLMRDAIARIAAARPSLLDSEPGLLVLASILDATKNPRIESALQDIQTFAKRGVFVAVHLAAGKIIETRKDGQQSSRSKEIISLIVNAIIAMRSPRDLEDSWKYETSIRSESSRLFSEDFLRSLFENMVSKGAEVYRSEGVLNAERMKKLLALVNDYDAEMVRIADLPMPANVQEIQSRSEIPAIQSEVSSLADTAPEKPTTPTDHTDGEVTDILRDASGIIVPLTERVRARKSSPVNHAEIMI